MSLLNRLRQAVSQSKFLQGLYNTSKIIIHISIFYLVREGLADEDSLNLKPKIDPCDIVVFSPADMGALSANPEEPKNEATLLKRISEGCICIGIKHHDEIAAYMWCNLRECRYTLLKFPLNADEAYLMDARTLSPYRGKNLAPYLRVELYKHLRKMGRTKFISTTGYTNEPAQRFKRKLNAKTEKLYVSIRLFVKIKWLILLKSYKI